MTPKPICGAHRKQNGGTCQAPALRNGRCKLHGGKSTGPRTAEGRARIAAAQRSRWLLSAPACPPEVGRNRHLNSADVQQPIFTKHLRNQRHVCGPGFSA